MKQQVDQYVRGLPNARVVVNELEVASSPSFMTQTQDTYLTSAVKTQLMTAEGVPSNSIKVTTDKGVVYLLGIVTTAEGDRATEVARNTSGVAKVVKAFDYVSEAERARWTRPPPRRTRRRTALSVRRHRCSRCRAWAGRSMRRPAHQPVRPPPTALSRLPSLRP